MVYNIFARSEEDVPEFKKGIIWGGYGEFGDSSHWQCYRSTGSIPLTSNYIAS